MALPSLYGLRVGSWGGETEFQGCPDTDGDLVLESPSKSSSFATHMEWASGQVLHSKLSLAMASLPRDRKQGSKWQRM